MISSFDAVSDLEARYFIKWSEGTQLESEEELATEVPCSFTAALNFMEVSHEKALKIYTDILEDHIGDMLKVSNRLRHILNSDMAKAVMARV